MTVRIVKWPEMPGEEIVRCACQHHHRDHQGYPCGCKQCGCPAFVEDL